MLALDYTFLLQAGTETKWKLQRNQSVVARERRRFPEVRLEAPTPIHVTADYTAMAVKKSPQNER